MSKKRTVFTPEFKEQAVSLWQNSESTAEEVAANLGIPDAKYITRWKSKIDKKGSDAFPGRGNLSGKDSEISKLKKQLKNTEIERDILKKAVGIFSRL
jgi:transposase